MCTDLKTTGLCVYSVSANTTRKFQENKGLSRFVRSSPPGPSKDTWNIVDIQLRLMDRLYCNYVSICLFPPVVYELLEDS